MAMRSESRFELRRVTEVEWVVRDHLYGPHDSRSTVACIWEIDVDECEVTWLRDFALSSRYASVAEVLDDLRAVCSRQTRPVPIPHFPPASEGPRRERDQAMPV